MSEDIVPKTEKIVPKKNVLRPIKSWLKKLNKPVKIVILVLIIAGIAVGTFFILRSQFTLAPGERLSAIAEDYYLREIEPNPKKSTSYTLVLKNLKTLGYDISTFEEDGCSLDSYAVIYINNTEAGSPYMIDAKLVGCE